MKERQKTGFFKEAQESQLLIRQVKKYEKFQIESVEGIRSGFAASHGYQNTEDEVVALTNSS